LKIAGLTAAMFKPIVFAVLVFSLLQSREKLSFSRVCKTYSSCLHNLVIKSCCTNFRCYTQIADRCAPWEVASLAENFVSPSL